MTGAGPDGLGDRMRGAAELSAEAAAAIEDLAAIADVLRAGEAADLLAVAGREIRDDSFGLMMLGRFSSGKSTLANALIGDAVGDVLPTGEEQTTPMLIRVGYAEEQSVDTVDRDGGITRWTLPRFWQEFVLDSDEDENDKRFDDVAECRIGVPADLLRHGVVLFDTPGSADTVARDDLIRDALNRCDAAIMVYTLRSAYGYDEIQFEMVARESQVRVFTVVNTFGREVTDKKRRDAWNKLVKARTGETYAGQDLAEWDIYFVDARAAGGDRDLLAPLAEALGRFLAVDRHDHHVGRYAHLALSQVEVLEEHIGDRERGLRDDLATVDATAERLDRDLAEAARKSVELIAMIKAAELDVRDDLRRQFDRSVAEFHRDVPDRLRRSVLPSWKSGKFGSAMNLMNRDKLAGELAKIAQEQAVSHLDQWAGKSQFQIQDRLESIAGDTEVSLRGIGEAYDEAFASVFEWQAKPLGTDRLTAPTATRPSGFTASKAGKVVFGAGFAVMVMAFPMVTIAVAAAALVAAPFVLAAVAVNALATLTMGDLVSVFLNREWAELKRRLEIYWQQLDAAVQKAFGSFLAEVTGQLAELDAVQLARTAESERALQAERDAIAAEGRALAALRARLEGAQVTLRRVAEAGRAG